MENLLKKGTAVSEHCDQPDIAILLSQNAKANASFRRTRKTMTPADSNSTREERVEVFTLRNELLLVERTGRMFRECKAAISDEFAEVFSRLGSDGESWLAWLLKLSGGRLLSRYFASSRQRLRRAAERPGLHHLTNLGGCPVRT